MDYPKSVPNIGLVGGKFVDENITTGQVGSLIPSDWSNAVTDEILAVIEEAGLAPDEMDNSQLKLAIVKIVEQSLPELPVEATPETIGLVVLATEEEAIAGTHESKAMTPLRVFQAIKAWVAQATETVAGLTRVASQEEVESGSNDEAFVTPKKLMFGFSDSPSGFTLPKCLGGFIVQWIKVDLTENTSQVIALPVPLQQHLITLPSVTGNPGQPQAGFSISTLTDLTNLSVYLTTNGAFPGFVFNINLLVVGR